MNPLLTQMLGESASVEIQARALGLTVPIHAASCQCVLLQCISPVMALSGGSQGGELTSAFGEAAEVHGRKAPIASEAYDPSPTLAVHCGNGFDAGLSPYQSTRLSRYNAVP
jgi:hypothetical protein